MGLLHVSGTVTGWHVQCIFERLVQCIFKNTVPDFPFRRLFSRSNQTSQADIFFSWAE